MNYWYGARSNEIFLDLDSHRAVNRAIGVLRIAIRRKLLIVRSVWLYQSSPRHYHLIVVLDHALLFVDKMAWSLWMGNDRLRVAYVMRRFINKDGCSSCLIDLLVAKSPYGFRTVPDATCKCKKKHKPKAITDKCPSMKMLLGDQRSADYFGRTGRRPSNGKIRLPWGRVPLCRIKEWKEPRNERRQKELLQDHGNVGRI